ncbi:hypothetical protein PVAG01_02265 [Phlyctema vagabunda]|uniref:DUF5672 domain-containing protein n=1 Tax=Phlyctema vagabunda TaxID=108571 RepID=A0ABR4PQ21_9HELO
MSTSLAGPSSTGIFVITRARILIVVSLIVTWTIAHLLPSYKPTIKAYAKDRVSDVTEHIPGIKVDWYPNRDPRDQFNSSKVALLIEGRPIPHLVPQLLHMISVVPPDWRFLFIGTNESVLSVQRSFATQYQIANGKLDLLAMPKPWSVDSKEHVFRLLTNIHFYDTYLPGVEWMLKFESDSIMCANSEDSLNDWLDYSWAGAPRSDHDRFAGNGGLSLRRISAVRRILGFQQRYNDTEPEDEWFGRRITVLPGVKVASATEEQHFTVEDVWHEKPMGYHARNGGESLSEAVWKSEEQRKKIFDYCPEISMIMPMKLKRERCDGDDHEGKIVAPGTAEPKKDMKDDKESR